MSNIKKTKNGLIERSTGRKIVSPLDAEKLLFSNKVTIVSNRLNEMIGEAHKLGYNPIVEVKKHSLSGNIPFVFITFFRLTDKNNPIYKKGRKS